MGQTRRYSPRLTIAKSACAHARLAHTRGLRTRAGCAHARVAQTRASAAIPAVAPCQSMILEALHYPEIKHAQRMRKLHVMRSFHVTATGTPRRTRQTGHTRRLRGGGAHPPVFAAGDPRTGNRGQLRGGKHGEMGGTHKRPSSRQSFAAKPNHFAPDTRGHPLPGRPTEVDSQCDQQRYSIENRGSG
jgi:hypothetical protein